MRVPFLDLGPQYRHYREEIDTAVSRVLESGWYILGPELRALEEEFAAYCGTRHAVGVGSGTEAIHLALRAAGIGPGDAVITVPNTAVPTVCAITASGAAPLFVDIDPRTYNLDPYRLREMLRRRYPSTRVKAVLPVHMYGCPADMAAIWDLASEYGLIVIGDAAQAHGAEFDGRRVGGLGQAECFSFYPTKNLGALGDAGMVVTNDEALALQVRRLRNYGEESKYQSRIPGFNSRLDEIQAAILRAKLKHLDGWNATRRRLARLYSEFLGQTPLTLPSEAQPARHCYHLYVVRHPERDALREYLEEHGVSTSIHYPVPVHLQEAYRYLGHAPGDFPEAECATREVLSLPLHPELADEELRYTCGVIAEFFRGRCSTRNAFPGDIVI